MVVWFAVVFGAAAESLTTLQGEFFREPCCADCAYIEQRVLPRLAARHAGHYTLIERDLNETSKSIDAEPEVLWIPTDVTCNDVQRQNTGGSAQGLVAERRQLLHDSPGRLSMTFKTSRLLFFFRPPTRYSRCPRRMT